ncbi:MAG: DUF4416 family protein [Chloroflexota bacterium]|nr:DUF4416 family protein [Chloroflexota bacterium]
MGEVKKPLPVKLIMPMFSRHEALFQKAEQALSERFGPTDYASSRLPFDHTTYYEKEMGSDLERQFLSFERLIDPGSIASIKAMTNELEEQWSRDGRRRINLDPGYIAPSKLVLATTKNHGHRIYLGQGIYAEVTLIYREGDFRPLPWTYPDYRTEAYREIMRAIREIYMAQLTRLRGAGKLTRQLG